MKNLKTSLKSLGTARTLLCSPMSLSDIKGLEGLSRWAMCLSVLLDLKGLPANIQHMSHGQDSLQADYIGLYGILINRLLDSVLGVSPKDFKSGCFHELGVLSVGVLVIRALPAFCVLHTSGHVTGRRSACALGCSVPASAHYWLDRWTQLLRGISTLLAKVNHHYAVSSTTATIPSIEAWHTVLAR